MFVNKYELFFTIIFSILMSSVSNIYNIYSILYQSYKAMLMKVLTDNSFCKQMI